MDRVAEAAAELADPWWILGGTAAALLGVRGGAPADVDVLASPADGRRLLDRMGGVVEARAHPRFRSELFGRIERTPLGVDVMSGFEVKTGEGWSPVLPQTRRLISWARYTLAVPCPAEQAAIFRLIGRAKDLRRAALLEALA